MVKVYKVRYSSKISLSGINGGGKPNRVNIINYLPPGIPDALMDVGGFNFFFFLGGGGTGESS